jgi:hypothetical protein
MLIECFDVIEKVAIPVKLVLDGDGGTGFQINLTA